MILVRLTGGMGNQMFQYAFGRALSIRHKTLLKLDLEYLDKTKNINDDKCFTPRSYSLDVFNISGSVASRSDVPVLFRMRGVGRISRLINYIIHKLVPNVGRERFFHFDQRAKDIGRDAYLVGYWQSPKYFNDISDILRQDFCLKEPLPPKTQSLFNEIANHPSVCVHIRRGDFVNNPLHDTFDLNYYIKGLDIISEKQKINRVYVFSDDIEWCKLNIKFKYPVTFVEDDYAGNRSTGHFVLMTACHHFVIANSSFSWWAAWLSTYPDKIVVAPKRWFLDDRVNTKDLTPPEWIRI